jgi:hypothetical protein
MPGLDPGIHRKKAAGESPPLFALQAASDRAEDCLARAGAATP